MHDPGISSLGPCSPDVAEIGNDSHLHLLFRKILKIRNGNQQSPVHFLPILSLEVVLPFLIPGRQD